jgi:hypothetical protein
MISRATVRKRLLIDELHKRRLEVIAVVCENCLRQFHGGAQALVTRDVPRFNDIVNLVLKHSLGLSSVPCRMTERDSIVASLVTDERRLVLGRRCPGLVDSRWLQREQPAEWRSRKLDEVLSLPQHPMREYQFISEQRTASRVTTK